MKTTHLIGCALTLATLLTTGCHVQVGTTPGVKPPVTTQSATGSVKVAFQGLGGYKTLATRYDIHRVEITLQPARGKAQFRQVDLKQLQQGSVNLDFKKIATGQAQLTVVAFDAGNEVIGKGYSSAHVASGVTAFMHVAVKLNPDAGTGDVSALITFEDGIDSEEQVFYSADRNGDGALNLEEYRETYMRGRQPMTTEAYPAVCGTPTPATACPMPPVMDPVYASFLQKDWNGDRLLSLDEFLGRIYAMPVPVAGTSYAEPAEAE